MRRLFALLAVGLASRVFATTYSIGVGQTYANFSALPSLSPDDVVQYCADSPGGTKTFTLSAYINPAQSGTSGHPITIKARDGDTITLDGNGAVAPVVYITTNYITIGGSTNNLTITGSKFQSVSGVIYYNGVTGLTVQHVNINVNCGGTAYGTDRRGVAGNGTTNSGITVDHCVIQFTGSLPWHDSGYDTDCLLLAGNGVTITNNTLTMNNDEGAIDPGATGHNDVISTLNCTNLLISGNVCFRDAPTTGSQGAAIYLEWYNTGSDASPTDYGYCHVWNNLFYGYGGLYLQQTNPRPEPNTKDPKVVIVEENNTFSLSNLSGTYNTRFTHGGTWSAGSLTVQNNIFENNLSSGTILAVDVTGAYSGANLVIDYNHYYCPNASDSSEFYYNGSGTNWTGFQAAVSGESHGIGYSSGWSDPKFTNRSAADYTLTSTSPDNTAGVNLYSAFTTDLNGATRPTSPTAWSIGAYLAYAGGSAPTAATSVAATVTGNRSLPWTWTIGTGGTDQTFKWGLSTGSHPNTAPLSASTAAYTIPNTAPDTTYYAIVTTTNANGSTDSTEASATTGAAQPAVGRKGAAVQSVFQ